MSGLCIKLLIARMQSRFPKAGSWLSSAYLENSAWYLYSKRLPFTGTCSDPPTPGNSFTPVFLKFNIGVSSILLFPEWILRCFCISVFPSVCQLYRPFHPSLFRQSSRNHARNVIPFFFIFFFKPRVCIFRIVNLSIFQEWFSLFVQYDPLPSMIVPLSYFLDTAIF